MPELDATEKAALNRLREQQIATLAADKSKPPLARRMMDLFDACQDILWHVDEANRFDRSTYLVGLRSLRKLEKRIAREERVLARGNGETV